MMFRMLVELQVENFAVVEKQRVRFHAGLNVLTGETITIDLSPGVKTITSSGAPAVPTPPGLPPRPIPPRRPMAGLSLAQSDLGVWSLKPDPIAASGNNVINAWIQDNTADTAMSIVFYDRWLDGDSAVTSGTPST